MKTVYIAAPFRGPTAWDVEQNIRVAENITLDVLEFGLCAVCPHTMYRFFDKRVEDEIALKAGLTLLSKCDCILVREDLDITPGVQKEIDYAKANSIPVYTNYEQLLIYLKP